MSKFGQYVFIAIVVVGGFMLLKTFFVPFGMPETKLVVWNPPVALAISSSGDTATSQVTVGNAAPVVSNVVLNAGSAIVLTPNATTAINISFTVTDQNGCGDVFGSGTVTSTSYRVPVLFSCTADNLNCYRVTTSTHNCTVATTTSANATATVQIYYFAQATDASSSFAAQAWEATVQARDAEGATSSASSTSVELNTLIAINVQTSTINYGTLTAGASSTGNFNAPFDNAGNASTSLQLSGTALVSGANVIATSSQEYATSSFNVGAGIDLSGTPTTVTGATTTSPTSTNLVSKSIFWGIQVPGGQATGTYTGTDTYDPVFLP